ncbi:hypothetical protein ACNF49_35220 [Actinomadura sp. ATCC 39365]
MEHGHQRHRRWSADDTWQRLLTALQAEQDAQGKVDWDISVDCTARPGKGDAARTNRGDPALAARLTNAVAVAVAVAMGASGAARARRRRTSLRHPHG